MKIIQTKDPKELGNQAGKEAGNKIREAIRLKGYANIILATGTSQFETINQLVKEDVAWEKVTVFHLDEYIGVSDTHPASFRKYLKERFVEKVKNLGAIYFIDGENNPEEVCKQLGELISSHPIDVALVGIGENGHLAFNDPPADFDTELPYLIVDLDEPCRLQQLNEGWFESLEDVPTQAISMSIRQILKAKHIICSVPDKRKAQAIKDCLENEVTNLHPSSILQSHPSCSIFLDEASASLLSIEIEK
ncbi:MAG TPA: glucosamine-6-phosphate deaminase [Lunatimonas sp.]|nr:glucosamine-6-phosphate deaminase [Lunatimonas sp.]